MPDSMSGKGPREMGQRTDIKSRIYQDVGFKPKHTENKIDRGGKFNRIQARKTMELVQTTRTKKSNKMREIRNEIK